MAERTAGMLHDVVKDNELRARGATEDHSYLTQPLLDVVLVHADGSHCRGLSCGLRFAN